MNKTAVKYGIFTGFAVIVYLFAFYLYDKSLMRHVSVLWSTIVIYFIGMFWATLSLHRNRGSEVAATNEKVLDTPKSFVERNLASAQEELPFSKMIATPFIVFLITNAYFVFFFYWIMNVYDPELLKIHQELTHQEMLDFYKGSEEFAQVKKNQLSDYTPTFWASIKQYIWGTIGGFLLSLLIGVVIRRT